MMKARARYGGRLALLPLEPEEAVVPDTEWVWAPVVFVETVWLWLPEALVLATLATVLVP